VGRGLALGDPQLIGRYRLLGRLGSGGMGRVYLGVSPGGRLVAVKVIRAELAADQEFRIRFSREVAAARRVSGLFTALVVDADVDGAMPWLATAYVAGPSLSEAVTSPGPMPDQQVLALAAGLAEGISGIHAAGVVHCDLKPSNVLLAQDGPRVIDFGISRAAEAASVSATGFVVGSPGFMSPEQATGEQVGPASDIFSLGAVLTFAATGCGPFGTGSAPELAYRLVYGLPRVDGLPDRLRPLVIRCLAKDPARRPTAGELLAEVTAAQSAAGWLPESVAGPFGRYAVPGPMTASARAGSSPVPVGPASFPAAPAPVPPDAASAPAGPAGARAKAAAALAEAAAATIATAGIAAAGPTRVPGGALATPAGAATSQAATGSHVRRRTWRPLAAVAAAGVVAVSGAIGFALSGAMRHPPAAGYVPQAAAASAGPSGQSPTGASARQDSGRPESSRSPAISAARSAAQDLGPIAAVRTLAKPGWVTPPAVGAVPVSSPASPSGRRSSPGLAPSSGQSSSRGQPSSPGKPSDQPSPPGQSSPAGPPSSQPPPTSASPTPASPTPTSPSPTASPDPTTPTPTSTAPSPTPTDTSPTPSGVPSSAAPQITGTGTYSNGVWVYLAAG